MEIRRMGLLSLSAHLQTSASVNEYIRSVEKMGSLLKGDFEMLLRAMSLYHSEILFTIVLFCYVLFFSPTVNDLNPFVPLKRVR